MRKSKVVSLLFYFCVLLQTSTSSKRKSADTSGFYTFFYPEDHDSANEIHAEPPAKAEKRTFYSSDPDQGIKLFDYDTYLPGVFHPNNIMIHVTQNLVNFLASTFFWFLFTAMFKQKPAVAKRKRRSNLPQQQAAVDISGKRIAQFLRVFASTAESFDRFYDEL